jgi:hypothetical protein
MDRNASAPKQLLEGPRLSGQLPGLAQEKLALLK